MGGVEGEGFAAAALAVAGFLNASDFVVNVIKDTASLVGALNQVAGFVVGVAAVDGAAGQRVLFAAGVFVCRSGWYAGFSDDPWGRSRTGC